MYKIKDIELANISRFRGELMGTAMLFIILFHVHCQGTICSTDCDAWAMWAWICFYSSVASACGFRG